MIIPTVKKYFKVLVCGGREFYDHKLFDLVMSQIHEKQKIETIIQGGARGADKLGYYWAAHKGIPQIQENADWQTHGKAAGPIRNQKMLKDHKPDLVVAFPGGRGTAHMVDISKGAKVPVIKVIDEKSYIDTDGCEKHFTE